MKQSNEAMTVIPFPQQPSDKTKQAPTPEAEEKTSVVALKELVASLKKEQNKVQDLLSSLGFALRSFSNLNQFLELTPLMAARVTDAVGGALVLYKNDSQVRLEQIHCQKANLGIEVRRAFEKVSYQINIATQKITSKSPKLLSNLLDDKIKQELGEKIKINGTPILVRNVEQGRLYVFSIDPEYQWTSTRSKLVQLVADQTAVAIANHELTVEVRSKERQDRELEIASEIQLRLLPSQCPQIEGIEISARCKTANRVGGDYYDFIPTNYDRIHHEREMAQDHESSLVPWSIVIGDVMGKGVPAGLIMTMTRGMLRAEVLNRNSPAQIMQHLNRVMYADLENSHRFVSMFYSEYDPKTRMLSFTNAAHNPPLWWEASSGKLKKLDTWGMLIGLDIDSEYEDDRVILAPGDTIIYYTDGFTDAVNANGARFDEENLRAAFEWACHNLDTTEEILDHLFNKVDQFMGKTDTSKDDMTLIVMRVSH